ncbi:MAG: hypothetical protein WEA58_12575 [Balneolaceae bacterium]
MTLIFRCISLLTIPLILLIGCNYQGAPSKNIQTTNQLESLADTSAQKTALNYFEWRYLDYDDFQRPLFSDLDYWFKDNNEEIKSTLEVAEVLNADDISLALIRYSVGSNIFRDAVWLRNYNGKWTISSNQYFSTYDDDPFKDGNPERAEEIINKEDEWTENSSERF